MISKPLPQREQLLSIWAKDRLADRETVEWAASALKEIRSSLGEDTANLLKLLDRWANESSSLNDETKKVWRLLRHAAEESRDDPESWLFVHGITEKIEANTLRTEDADRLIDCFRPRLKAAELSSWVKNSGDSGDDRPLRWVNWDFTTSIQSSYQPHLRLKKVQFAKLPTELLSRLIERGTAALRDALNVAEEIEWVGGKRDLPNHFVHRVYISEKELLEGNPKEVEDRDPDAHNNNFAPLVRTIAAALFALADKNSGAAQPLITPWRLENTGLFLRLVALAGWQPNLVSGEKVGEFLEGVNNHAFWRWMIFPEIATLRALRWNDLGKYAEPLAARLLEGPNNDAFLSEEEIPAVTKQFHKDHELARLVDNHCDVPQEFNKLVAQRRAVDERFPPKIPAVEQGQEAVRVRWVPEGDPDIFSNVPTEQLLARLLAVSGQHKFEQGNDAEAFGRSVEGKRRILEALALGPVDQEQIDAAWNLLLSYPHEKAQDAETSRETVEVITKLALKLPEPTFSRLAGQLCYWLDKAEEIFSNFERADELWSALLPFAASEANQKQVSEDASDEVDLTMAALNEPLGHLLSTFVRRCPSMPAKKEDRPSLPVQFAGPLKGLTGRAKELLANRMVVTIPYFVLADEAWLEGAVISVLAADGIASDRLWEAFAKYGQIPPPDVWSKLQQYVFRGLRSFKLSPEARRRLAEMSVIVWVWSKDPKSKFKLDTGSLRSAFSLANDEARGAAAWQFSHLFHSKDESKAEGEDDPIELWPKLGATFFQEIWPLEPALQSPATANDFARIPAGVGEKYFAEALSVVLPCLLPFEVWAVLTEFQIDPDKPNSEALVKAVPEDMLVLLAVCISEKQGHGVYDLKPVLDWIVEVRPDLEHDYRMRLLRRMA